MTTWTADHFIGGEVALDFANTVYRRTPELGADLLDDDSLSTWLQRTGLGGGAPLADARELRHHLWSLFEAQASGHDIPADTMTGLLTAASGATVGPDGTATATDAVAVLALHGLRLALTPLPIRTCDRCGWFFTDTSKARRRRWCSMKTCGNQAKAARHRVRKSA